MIKYYVYIIAFCNAAYLIGTEIILERSLSNSCITDIICDQCTSDIDSKYLDFMKITFPADGLQGTHASPASSPEIESKVFAAMSDRFHHAKKRTELLDESDVNQHVNTIRDQYTLLINQGVVERIPTPEYIILKKQPSEISDESDDSISSISTLSSSPEVVLSSASESDSNYADDECDD